MFRKNKTIDTLSLDNWHNL